jgi:hypothetical protein
MYRLLQAPKAKLAVSPGRCAAQVEAVVQEEADGIVTVANGNTIAHAMPCHANRVSVF